MPHRLTGVPERKFGEQHENLRDDDIKAKHSVLLALALLAATWPLNGQSSHGVQAAPSADQSAPLIPPDQLDSLVAPIALYPDPLLAQVLAASTYPLELIQLQQWLTKNKNLKDKALVDAVRNNPGIPVFRPWRRCRMS